MKKLFKFVYEIFNPPGCFYHPGYDMWFEGNIEDMKPREENW